MTGQPHLIARVRPELAQTEPEKSCHFFPIPADVRGELRAYCGFTVVPGQAEQLDGPAGMPCVACLLIVSVPGADQER